MSRYPGRVLMVLLWGIIGVFSGCAEGLLLDRMLRPNRDPEVNAPEVISFEKENLISVRWREDTAADSYILHRALDGVKLNWEQIYIGRALRYDDTEVPHGQRRFYRMSAARGEKVFGPSADVMGVGADMRRDDYEPNDTRGQAALLTADLSATLWFFTANNGREMVDTDWYKVRVPPRRQANIIVTDTVNTGKDKYILQYRDGSNVTEVVSGFAFALPNRGYREAEMMLRITPNPQTFYKNQGLAGGRIITYDISLHSITELK